MVRFALIFVDGTIADKLAILSIMIII